MIHKNKLGLFLITFLILCLVYSSVGSTGLDSKKRVFATKTQIFIKQFVTGDSFTAQHPSTAHFGLGGNDLVEKIEVLWPNGKKITLNQPAIGKYHQLTP